MYLPTLAFIQSEGFGWLTWAIIGVVASLALFLIFFFVKSIRKAEKETEDEWTLTPRRSIFTDAPPPPAARETISPETISPESAAPEPAAGTEMLSSAPEAGEIAKTELLRSIPAAEPEPERQRELERPREPERPRPAPDQQSAFKRHERPAQQDKQRGTELLASRGPERDTPERVAPERVAPESGLPESSVPERVEPERVEQRSEQRPFNAEQTPLNNEVWAGLEADEQAAGHTQALDASSLSFEDERETPRIEARQTPPPAPPEPLGEARVDRRGREYFEPPVIEPVKRREAFEPPAIEPLESPEEPPAARDVRPAVLNRDLQPQPRGLRSESEDPVYSGQSSPQPAAPHAVATAGPPDRARRSGSVLNLPSEASNAPMIFGEVAPDRETRAIGSLSNYGKPADDSKGRGWKIGLPLLLLVIAALALTYYFVRPFNAWVDEWFARVRGRNLAASKPPAQPEYKAQIYLARAAANNNSNSNTSMARARGQVINTSDSPLEALSVEIELVRKDGAPPDLRTVPVNPATLAPKQQGVFEIDLDRNLYTGPKLSKLISNGSEVPFNAPGLTKPQSQPQPQSQ